jgi:alkanesulfonate monooxygenase SsuD/methylene tetrahydromethanopterin reductase-like flavin-dependent oxidoreductase (luciferase family)
MRTSSPNRKMSCPRNEASPNSIRQRTWSIIFGTENEKTWLCLVSRLFLLFFRLGFLYLPEHQHFIYNYLVLNFFSNQGGMMDISVSFPSPMGINWVLWKQLVPRLDGMGFKTTFLSDHFSMGSPPVTDAAELITFLTYLADHTQRVNFGSLVASICVHDPVRLARQAMSLDILSGGRMILGVGTGSIEQEHTRFGYKQGDRKTRMDRFDEALAVITGLIRSEDPISFQGKFYQLQDARMLPHPQRPTRILIGGNGPKRTLPLVAKYANVWNCEIETPERFHELSTYLNSLLIAAGRAPSDVKRTLFLPVLCYHSADELRQALDCFRKVPIFSQSSDEDLLGVLQYMKCISGGPVEVIEKMQVYADAGVEEFVIQWMAVNNFDGLQTIASEILPHFAASS